VADPASSLADLTARLVAIDSTNPNLVPGGAGEGEVARFVAGWLERAGMKVRVEEAAPGRPNVVARARGTGNGSTLLLNAHTDTVGAGGMVDPFLPRIDGDRLVGRGAFDMKASLAAIMLVGAEAVRRDWRGDVVVAAVADEEFASVGTQRLVETVRADAAVVAEPTDEELCIAHKGFAWLQIETRGRAAHGSLADEGIDAIAAMGPVLSGIAALDRRLAERPSHPLLGRGSLHASLIAGGTELSTYPDRCLLSLERRTVPGETAAAVEAELHSVLEAAAHADPNFAGSLRMTLWREPFAISPDDPLVRLARRAIAGATGREPPLAGAFGWMDSALLAAAGIPTVVYGPAGDGAHADHEWVDLPSAERCLRGLLAVAEAVCA
jgi:acetylornithine deacetylase